METNENDSKPKNKIPLPKRPQFNYYWIYGIIVVLLLGLQFVKLQGSTHNLDYNDFFSMLDTGDVSKVIIVNNDFAEVYVKADSLKKARYKKDKVDQSPLGGQNAGPHYSITITSAEKFQDDLQKAEEKLAADRRAPWTIERRQNLADHLTWLLPVIFLAVLWIFLMRRMSGGAGGPGGQIFNIGKSKAALFDSNKVNVTFNDVAGLDEAKEEVMEIVDFLKNPKKYTKLGGKIRKVPYW